MKVPVTPAQRRFTVLKYQIVVFVGGITFI